MGESQQGLVEVYRTLNVIEAHMVTALLEAEGIVVAQFDDVTPGIVGGATIPVRVMVSLKDLEAAKRVIQTYEKQTGG